MAGGEVMHMATVAECLAACAGAEIALGGSDAGLCQTLGSRFGFPDAELPPDFQWFIGMRPFHKSDFKKPSVTQLSHAEVVVEEIFPDVGQFIHVKKMLIRMNGQLTRDGENLDQAAR